MSEFYLLLYVLMWLITILIYYFKSRSLDATLIIMISYFLYAIMSYMLYINPIYSNRFKELSLFSFFYLYVMLIIGLYPLMKYNISKVNRLEIANITFVRLICWVYILATIIGIPDYVSKIGTMVSIFTDTDAGLDLYSDTLMSAGEGGKGISNLPAIIKGLFSELSFFFLFYLIAVGGKNNRITILFMVFAIVFNSLGSLFIGQRGGMVYSILTFIVTYFLFFKFIPDHINRVIRKVSFVFVAFFVFAISILTISRFGDSTKYSGSIFDSVVSYVGQANINFNLYGLDDGGIRYGDRTAALFKKIMGFSNVPSNFVEVRVKYPNLYINDESFVTYVGDFTIDYGPFPAMMIFLFFSFIFTKRTKVVNGEILVHRLVLIHFVSCVCMNGGMSLFTYSLSNNLKIFMVLLIWFFFKLERNCRVYQNKNKYGISFNNCNNTAER